MKNLLERNLLFAPEDKGAGGGDSKGNGDAKPKGENDKGKVGELKSEPTFEEWLVGQDDTVKGLIDGHVKGLKTALGSEREARGQAEQDLRDVAGKLEEGSAAQKEVLRLADDVAVGNTKADFYEDAHEAGVSNLKLAYHVAVTDDLFDKRGNVNFDKMKEAYPELFGKPPKRPKAGAGEGAGEDLSGQADMNLFIRRSAGKDR